MRLATRGRILLARHRWIYWLVLAAVAAGLGAIVIDRVAALDRARDRWDDVQTVQVARHDHRPDDPLTVDEVDLPLAAVPPTALTEPPDELVARRHIATGEILVDNDVMTVDGPATRARPGTIVVGIPDGPATAASIGLRVSVASDGLVLALHGMVVDVRDDIAYVAVDAEVAAMVAHAARQGTASLMFVP